MSLYRSDGSTAVLPGDAVARQNPLSAAQDTDATTANNTAAAAVFDVIIVGGGLSGMVAAAALHDQGLNVVVLEAKARLGGRTLTSVMQGAEGPVSVDLGGQWVSSSQPHVMALLQRLNIPTTPQYEAGNHVIQLDDGVVRKYSGTIPSVLGLGTLASIGWLEFRLNARGGRINFFNPFTFHEAEEFDYKTVAESARLNTLPWCRDKVYQMLALTTRVVFGCDPQQVSLANFLETCRAAGGFRKLLENGNGGGQEFRIVGGAQQLSLRLADHIGHDRVRLSSPVTHITQSVDQVTVTTATGAKFTAQHLILAVPPHLVVRIVHQPPLPTWRDQLGQQMPIGHLIKVVITYQQAFWRQRGYSGQAASSRGPLCTLFDGCSDDGQTPKLVGFIGGTQATMWSSVTLADRREGVLRQVADFFSCADALEPLDYAEKDWAKEPYNGGCPVARMAPGTAASLAWRLRQPVGRIHFAGTELATTWSGFLNGAVESGQRAAEDVLAMQSVGHEGESGLVEHLDNMLSTPYPMYPPKARSVLDMVAPALNTLLCFSSLSFAVRLVARAFGSELL